MNKISITKKDETIFNAMATHPLQSFAWGEFREHTGVEVIRVGLGTEKKLLNGFQLTIHHIPHTPWTIGYVPKGLLPTKEIIDQLKIIGKEKKCVFIQLEPNVKEDPTVIKLLKTLSPNITPSYHPLFTTYNFLLDLTLSEEELLKHMHPKTRYNIKVAIKRGVVVSEDNSADAFAEYIKLSEETTKRQGFYAHTTSYHHTMWKILHKAGIAHLWKATFENQTLAAWIIFTWKDTLYYPYGASSREHKEVMAPTLLLWKIAQWGKTHNFKKFDLWGALGPNPDSHDPWYGFHRFKEGFHPELVTYVGSYDLVLNPALYMLYKLADKLRWSMLRLKQKF